MTRKSLSEYFAEIVELSWREYLAQERSPDVTSRQALLFAIVRACVEGKLPAIQTSLDRLDGPVARNIKTILPKFYTEFPYAKSVAVASSVDDGMPTLPSSTEPETQTPPLTDDGLDPEQPVPEELPTGKLRPVLDKMMDSPQNIPESILKATQACDKYDYSLGNPTVKSAIVAGLVKLAHNGKMSAIDEILNQLDGKVAEVYHLLGDDVVTTSYALEAPAGSVKGENGVYRIENKSMGALWIPRLEKESKRGGR